MAASSNALSPTGAMGVMPTSQDADVGKSQRLRDLMEGVRREHLDALWRYVRARCDDAAAAEDLVAETFASAWTEVLRARFPRDPWPWLVGIARRKIADWWRAQGRKRRERTWTALSALERERIASDWAERSEVPVLSEDAKALLREALSALRPEMQELLLAHHVDGVSLKDLACRSGKSLHAIESALARARAVLRKAFTRRKGLFR